jgi:hypothetical protein
MQLIVDELSFLQRFAEQGHIRAMADVSLAVEP